MQFGIAGQTAPELRVADWIDGDGAPRAPFRLADHPGEVRVIFAFQAWCPACHSYGFPMLQRLTARFGDAAVFAAVQTVFEGFEANGPEKRREMQRRYTLSVPIGQDEAGPRPTFIADYRTGGTPWFVVITQGGAVLTDGYRPDRLEETVAAAVAGTARLPTPAPIAVRHDRDQGRYLVDFGGGHVGELVYERRGDVLRLTHSEVPAALRGRGYGGALMERALAAIEAEGLKVIPVCGYTVAYLRRYKRWAHLLAA